MLASRISGRLIGEVLEIKTERLRLVLQTREEVEQMLAGMSEYDRAQVSPEWLARVRASGAPDPWSHGFRVTSRDSGTVVGTCGFKGPPVAGVVEIAYGTEPEYRGRGYATEVAQALVDYALRCSDVRLVRAHTLPDAAASKRVLLKCHFDYVGETTDPEDGTVARFERNKSNAGDPDST